MNTILPAACFWLVLSAQIFAQGSPPWNNALKMTWSSDGVTFNESTVFQDSSGVPSVIKWHGDTLIAAFQWFRQPNPSPSWDRVAVKYSYDNGVTWSEPLPIIVKGLPGNYQRPFDPTLAATSNDSIRIYFSSSVGMPQAGQDSSINTYSAISTDGVNYAFESGPRVDHPTNRVIDPAVVFFNGAWHYTSPVGSPQQGAYHYVSPDGLNFSPVPPIPSDNTHNWTGNFIVESSTELRFYGSGPQIWYKASANGGVWSGYVPTNIAGGDPTVVKTGDASYLMIYVGRPNTSNIASVSSEAAFSIFPNPARDFVAISSRLELRDAAYLLVDLTGRILLSGVLDHHRTSIDIGMLKPGLYFLRVGAAGQVFTVMKQRT